MANEAVEGNDAERVLSCLADGTIQGVEAFFRGLSFRTDVVPRPVEFEELPESARAAITGEAALVAEVPDPAVPFRVFAIPVSAQRVRTSVRSLLTAFYRKVPQGNNLFVVRPDGEREPLLVYPERILDPRDPTRVRLLLRRLELHPREPYRTELDVVREMRLRPNESAAQYARRLAAAMSCERVTEAFYRDFQRVFEQIKGVVTYEQHHRGLVPAFVHILLNRLMFLYFIERKGYLLGPDGGPSRHFVREVWRAYRDARKTGHAGPDTFYDAFLKPIFFEAFNRKFDRRPEYLARFPDWLVRALASAPYLNGGLFSEREVDRASIAVPDQAFSWLFDFLPDGATPGLFERYHFTIVETSRLDEEVAVDPEVIGRVYESLVNRLTERDTATEAGVFYTPRTEIDLMGRLALTEALARRLNASKDKRRILTEFVFALDEDEARRASERVTRADLWPDLDKALRTIRVLDPACGSGSFLVGMLLILDELEARCDQALHGGSERPYNRRKRIIAEQLYGVDCLEWAVRVAELRLWLQLVVETPLQPEELTLDPLLPNLDFKVRVGDSLIQTIGPVDVTNLELRSDRLSSAMRGRISVFAGRKKRHCYGRSDAPTAQNIRQEENHLFAEILMDLEMATRQRLKEVQSQIAGGGANPRLIATLPPSEAEAREVARLREERARLEEELRQILAAREAFQMGEPLPFVPDISFAEVAQAGGFDLIIGNPPYVRQEQVADPLGRFERDEYLRRIRDAVQKAWPQAQGVHALGGRNDYLVYFYLLTLRRLARTGAFCFITSNAWLDVDYGKDLQEFLLRHAHLRMVVDNRARRSFARADVNTVITLISRVSRSPLARDEARSRAVRFVAFRRPFEEVESAVVVEEIEEAQGRLVRPEFRVVVKDQDSLLDEGLGDRKYEGGKWGGRYLRAPDIYFTILEKGKGKLVRLGEIAEVRRGITTGANEFFYLEPVGRSVAEVARIEDPMTPVRVRNGAGWEGEIEAAWLKPVIKSPREIKTIRVRLEDLRYLIFMKPEKVKGVVELGENFYFQPPYPFASIYISWGAGEGYPQRATCAHRWPWWDLGTWGEPSFFWPDAYNHRFLIPESERGIHGDKRFFILYVTDQNRTVVGAWLNASITPLFIELEGISNLGEGVIYTNVYWLKTLRIAPRLADDPLRRATDALRQLGSRPLRSIFEELGFPLCRSRGCNDPEHPYEHVHPESLTLDQVQRASPDRFELDRVVFDVLGLDDSERREVYRAVADLVKTRLAKARSTRRSA